MGVCADLDRSGPMNPPVRHRAVIVDDERLARRDLATQLAAFPEIEIVGQAATAAEAEQVLARLRPDVVFLDVQLPDVSGFDLLARLPAAPRIIFVTAHERYAVRAFKVNALDYLLKPVETAQLAEALRRLTPSPRTTPGRDSAPPFVLGDHCYAACGNFRGFVAIRTIRRVVAEGNYTAIHTTEGRQFEIKQSLQVWERRLPPESFARINRNEIVQVSLISRLMPAPSEGGYEIELTGETEPRRVSRRALVLLRERFSHLCDG